MGEMLKKAVLFIMGSETAPGAIKIGSEVIQAGSGMVDNLIAKDAVQPAVKAAFEGAAKTIETDAAAAGAKIAGLKDTVTAPFGETAATAGGDMAELYAKTLAEAAGKEAPGALKGAGFESARLASESAIKAGFVDGLTGKIAASEMASKEVRTLLGLKQGVKITKDHMKELVKKLGQTGSWKKWGRICMLAGIPAGALVGAAAIGYQAGENKQEEVQGERTDEQFSDDDEWGKNSSYWMWVVANVCFGSHIPPERLPSLVDLLKNCPQGIIERACEQITMLGSLTRIVETPMPLKRK